VYRTVENG